MDFKIGQWVRFKDGEIIGRPAYGKIAGIEQGGKWYVVHMGSCNLGTLPDEIVPLTLWGWLAECWYGLWDWPRRALVRYNTEKYMKALSRRRK